MNVLMARAGWFNYCLCVLWSLSVEEVFYLAFPLLCAGLRRDALLLAAWIGLILAGPAWRLAHQDDEAGFLYAYLACFDGIAVGCCAALLDRRAALPARLARLLPAAAVPAMAATYLWRSIGETNVWGVTAMSLGTACLLLASARARPGGARAGSIRRGLEGIGRHSYELYLFHLLVLAAMRAALPPDRIAPVAVLPWLTLYLLASLALGVLIARYYAEPARRAIRSRPARA